MLLAGVCTVYSALAWLARGDKHLAGNALLYGALTAYEGQMVQRHQAKP